jgi:hypothetical protein
MPMSDGEGRVIVRGGRRTLGEPVNERVPLRGRGGNPLPLRLKGGIGRSEAVPATPPASKEAGFPAFR